MTDEQRTKVMSLFLTASELIRSKRYVRSLSKLEDAYAEIGKEADDPTNPPIEALIIHNLASWLENFTEMILP